jgi:hypothetical protein
MWKQQWVNWRGASWLGTRSPSCALGCAAARAQAAGSGQLRFFLASPCVSAPVEGHVGKKKGAVQAKSPSAEEKLPAAPTARSTKDTGAGLGVVAKQLYTDPSRYAEWVLGLDINTNSTGYTVLRAATGTCSCCLQFSIIICLLNEFIRCYGRVWRDRNQGHSGSVR